MSANQLNPEEWGRRLEAGDRSDPALRLAAQLEQNRPAAPRLDHASRENLRRRLLRQADATPAQRLGSLAVSFAVTLLLATAVALFWTSQAGNQPILPGAADDAQTVDLTLLDEQAEAMQLELALLEETVSAERWELRRIVQAAAGDDLLIRATFAYTATDRPASAHFVLLPANPPTNDNAEPFVLNMTALSETADTATAEFLLDPLAVWQRFGSFDLVLARVTEWDCEGERVVETMTFADRPLTLRTEWLDRLWLNSASPGPGTPLDRTAFTVELGYRLLSAPSADIRLLVAHPTWESANLGAGERLPVKGAGDPASVTRGEGTLTFTFTTEDAAYLRQVIGAEATLAANMLVPGADGVMQALAQKTFADYAWPVADAAVELPPDQLWFVSISPEPGATVEEGDLLTAVLGYELHSADEGWIYLSLTHAEWDGPNPPTTAFGSQTITAGTGQIELEFTADDLAALQSRAGQFVRLTAALGASDEQNQHRRLADAAWEDAPWQLGTVMAGVPRMMPQVAVFPDNRDTAVTRLDILNIESGASFATGMTPITFTVELAYQLASRQAEEAIVTIYIAAAGTGARVPLALVAETVQAGRGIIEATFDFNPQRDLNESQRRLPRSFELVITIDRQDGTLLTYTGTSADWEFRP